MLLATLLGILSVGPVACGGGAAVDDALQIQPTNATLEAGDVVKFAVPEAGSYKAVDWSVSQPDGGSVDGAGYYQAPDTEGVYTVLASMNSKQMRTDVTVAKRSSILRVSPKAAALLTGETLTFSANCLAGPNHDYSWTVQEGVLGGTVSTSGVYTAPELPGTYHVVAARADDPSIASVATITVAAPTVAAPEPIVTPSPTPTATPTPTDTPTPTPTATATPTPTPTPTPTATATPTPTPTPTAAPAPAPTSVDAGACTKLVSDTNARTQPSLAMPGYLQSVIDPVFGTRITRVTGDPGAAIPNGGGQAWRSIGGPNYAKQPSWNADQSMMVSEFTSAPGWLFIDANTYQVVRFRSQPAGTVINTARWHPTNKDLMIYVTPDGKAGTWNPALNTVQEKFNAAGSLSGCTMGAYEGNVSSDGNLVVIQCGDSFFLANLATNQKSATITAAQLGFSGLDWASVSLRGGYVVASQDWQLSKAAPLSMSMTAASFRTSWTYMGHFDLGVDTAGNEVAYEAGQGIMVRLSDGVRSNLGVKPGANQGHSSTRNLRVAGWGFGSLAGVQGTLTGEIIAHELSPGGQIRRLAHHRTKLTTGDGGIEPRYDAMPFGSVSPDGRKVFFRSDWGTGGNVYGFVVDIAPVCP